VYREAVRRHASPSSLAWPVSAVGVGGAERNRRSRLPATAKRFVIVIVIDITSANWRSFLATVYQLQPLRRNFSFLHSPQQSTQHPTARRNCTRNCAQQLTMPKRVHEYAFRVDDHRDMVVETRESPYYPQVCYLSTPPAFLAPSSFLFPPLLTCAH